MKDYLPLAISALAALLAVMPFPGFERARQVALLVALGCGQIYIAVAALIVFLLVETGARLRGITLGRTAVWYLMLMIGIAVTTAIAPRNTRTYFELAQLVAYVIIFLLAFSYINTGERLMGILKACTYAALAVAGMGLATVMLGLQTAPHIFLARGSNEGAVFLSLIGVLPAATLFVRTRNPLYLVIAAVLIYPQFVATSRGSMIVSVLVLLTAAFFFFANRFVRAVLLLAGLYIAFVNLPVLSTTYQAQLNFSARERLSLFNWGIWLWSQQPIVGWGWGSTTGLAEQAPTTELFYPHFHNSFVQLLVEAGVVGVAIIASFAHFVISRSLNAMSRLRQSAASMLVVATGIALIVSGFFDAMLYGADRAIQVILLIVFAARASESVRPVGVPFASMVMPADKLVPAR